MSSAFGNSCESLDLDAKDDHFRSSAIHCKGRLDRRQQREVMEEGVQDCGALVGFSDFFEFAKRDGAAPVQVSLDFIHLNAGARILAQG